MPTPLPLRNHKSPRKNHVNENTHGEKDENKENLSRIQVEVRMQVKMKARMMTHHRRNNCRNNCCNNCRNNCRNNRRNNRCRILHLPEIGGQ